MRSSSLSIVALALLSMLALASVIGASGGHLALNDADSEQSQPSGILHFGGDANISIVITYFYQSGCPHCAIAEPYVDSMATKYPQVSLVKLEISHNNTNYILFQEFNARFDVQNPRVPSIQIGQRSLVGEDDIKANLEMYILQIINASVDEPDDDSGHNNTHQYNETDDEGANDTVVPPVDDPDTGSSSTVELTLAAVVMAAAVDSINPCAISVMIFLLIFLTSLGDRKRVIMVGVVYIVTVYIVYFAAGLGLLVFLQSLTMTRLVYYGAAIVSLAVGLVNIAEFFVRRDKPTIAIPESRKPLIKKYIVKASIPAAVILGVMVSMFELPCTGAIYFAILNLLSNNMTFVQGVPYLALYNLIFVLPLAAILGIIVLGVSADKANSWRIENRGYLRLVVGAVMVGLGALMLLGVF